MARILLLTTLTMVAFAANSLLNRAALADGETGPAAFAALRLLSGAICLSILVAWRRGRPRLFGPGRLIGTSSLAVYMLGFSFAYVALDAGLGALILFGMVQLTMFSGAFLAGDRLTAPRWIGSLISLAGLAWLVWPGDVVTPSTRAMVLMAAAGIAWGIYSLVGRRAGSPLDETATNFICASPVAFVIWWIFPDTLTLNGAIIAIICGAVTSGLGYALWYSVLPRLAATVAALTQLTVPVIAVTGGTILLSEPLTWKLGISSAVILGGVAFGILGQRKIASSGS